MKEELPQRLREISETVDDWNAPICARVDLIEAAKELEHLRDSTSSKECSFKLEMMNPRSLEWDLVCNIGNDYSMSSEIYLDQGQYRIVLVNGKD